MHHPRTGSLIACVLPLMLLAGASACSSTGGGPNGDSRLITLAQLEATHAPDLLEAIRRARPLWLRDRSPRSLGAIDTRILVFFNGSLMGRAEETLSHIPLEGIERVEYLDAAEAGLLPGAGTGHVQAAFMVYTTRDP